MPEHIRALIAVLALSATLLYFARAAMIQLIPAPTYDRWRRLWFFTTLAWFLSGSFWIYVMLMIGVLIVVRQRERQPFSLYIFLLFAAPPISAAIPGMGVIDHLFMLDHYRLLALVLLLPAAIVLMQDGSTPRFGRSPVDWMVLGYLTLTWLLNMPETSLTNGIRIAFLQYIDGFLPYYVASRSIRTIADFRAVLSALLLGALLLSVLAIFEVIRGWKIYEASISALGLFAPQGYKMRGPFLRPGASVMDSIVLGLVIVVAMGALLYLKEAVVRKKQKVLAWLVLIFGLLASLSRAPWMAAILLFAIYIFQGEKVAGQLVKALAIAPLLLIVLSFFPAGKAIIDLIPLVGDSEQGSIEYRANWLSASLPLIERNFWFGDVKVLDAPELEVMRQGEGIIDLVNMFLAVLLYYGAVGLFFFVGMFWTSLRLIRRSQRQLRAVSTDMVLLGRVLLCILISIAFVISTLSAISIVPILIWTFMALASAYAFRSESNDLESIP